MKKKLAIIAPYIGIVDRGAESFVKELSVQLSVKYDIDIFTLDGKAKLAGNNIGVPVTKSFIFIIHEKLFERYNLYRKIMWKFYFMVPDVLFQYRFSKTVYKKYLADGNYNLLFPNNGIGGVCYADKLRKIKGTAFIYTGHGGIGKGEELILKKVPDMYICLTRRQYKWAEKYSKNICIIGNGVNVNKFNFHTTSNKEKIVLSVGALTEFKRHELTIKAMQYVKNARLVILGRGELEVKLKKLANKLLGDRCSIESVSYEQIASYYEKADLFVLPSSSGEAYGIVYLEAMASNLPVVAPDDTMRHEIIGKAGIFCDVTNISEYARCIIEALSLQWGNIPRNTAWKSDWKKVSQKYIDIIEKII